MPQHWQSLHRRMFGSFPFMLPMLVERLSLKTESCMCCTKANGFQFEQRFDM